MGGIIESNFSTNITNFQSWIPQKICGEFELKFGKYLPETGPGFLQLSLHCTGARFANLGGKADIGYPVTEVWTKCHLERTR
jgi:hypothetical protein